MLARLLDTEENALLMNDRDYESMHKQPGPCEHRWRYFVNLESRSVKVRECEHCGHRAIVPTELAPLPRPRKPEKLSA